MQKITKNTKNQVNGSEAGFDRFRICNYKSSSAENANFLITNSILELNWWKSLEAEGGAYKSWVVVAWGVKIFLYEETEHTTASPKFPIQVNTPGGRA